MTDDERRQRGQDLMLRLFGKDISDALPHEGFREMTVSHLFGDVWTRPGLELRERSLLTCAVLTALGREPQLRGHLKAARHIGISRQTIEELIVHVAHYAGWPTAVSGLRIAAEVFEEPE